MPEDTMTLVCPECGNDSQFDAVKAYVHKVILDGYGQVESSRVDTDLEDEELEISCRECGAPVSSGPETPFARRIEGHLQTIDAERSEIMNEIAASREISFDAAEDLGVAACAITDAIGEVREELERHQLCAESRQQKGS